MEKINFGKMESLEGGKLASDGWKATGLMCGMTLFLAVTPGLQPIAVASGAGCATGLYAMFS